MATARISWGRKLRVWCFDIEARPGPWGGGDFTFKSLLSIAGGYDRAPIDYLAPGFSGRQIERFVRPMREGNNLLIVGHNALKYDLPLLNGTLIKLGKPSLPPLLVTDTYKHLMKRDLAFSASLGNMAERFGIRQKGSMSEYAWERAYDGDPEYLEKLRRYNMGDVATTLELYHELAGRGLLKPPMIWRP